MFDQVAPTQLSAWLASAVGPEQSAVLLDVREPWEHALVNLAADARFEHRHIPMAQLPQSLGLLDRQQPIICLCHHGVRSLHVAAYLAQQGFTQVANLQDGIDAWAAQCAPDMARY